MMFPGTIPFFMTKKYSIVLTITQWKRCFWRAKNPLTSLFDIFDNFNRSALKFSSHFYVKVWNKHCHPSWRGFGKIYVTDRLQWTFECLIPLWKHLKTASLLLDLLYLQSFPRHCTCLTTSAMLQGPSRDIEEQF